jgi:hypothetical protein
MEHTDSVKAQPEQTTHRRLNRRGWRRLLWWTGLAILTGVYVVMNDVLVGIVSPFWMIGPFITSAGRTIVVGTLAGTAAWTTCLCLWVTGPHTRSHGLTRRIWRVACILTTFLTAATLLLLDGLLSCVLMSNALQRSHVLSPASPGGCQVMLWRTSNDGSGASTWVYLKVPGSVTLRQLPGDADVNPDTPKQSLRLTLTWTGDQAHLQAQQLTHPFSTWNPYPDPIICPVR